MAQYPSGTPNFTTKANGEVIQPGHINDLQQEITAIAGALLTGLAHSLIPDATNTRDLGTALKKWRELFLDGAINASASNISGTITVGGGVTVAGTVTAAGFVGDASGLTGVPVGDKALQDLTDVTIATPTNGQLLTYNSATTQWENQPAPAGGGGGSSVPVGTVTMYAAGAAPGGWLLCNGQAVAIASFPDLFAVIGGTYGWDGVSTFNVPNLTLKFPIGLYPGWALGTIGGEWNHQHWVPGHGHTSGTLIVSSHSHDSGTLSIGSHTHSSGSYSIAAHTHHVGTIATNSTGNHEHYVNQHTHPFSVSGTTGTESRSEGGPEQPSEVSYATDGHTHSFSASGTTGNSSSSTRTDSSGSHSHTLTGNTGSSSPSVSGTSGAATATLTGNTGAVAPAISGSVSADPGMATDGRNPPFIALNFIIKT